MTQVDPHQLPTSPAQRTASALVGLARRLAKLERTSGGMPTGTLLATALPVAPPGYLACEGQPVSRTTYAALFSAIGTTYGAGDGSTTFNVPDLRGRVPVGADGAAGRLSANDALGQSGGTETHTLTVGQLPSHTHQELFGNGPGALTTGTIGVNLALYGAGQSGGTGGDQAHPNMQPFQIVNYIIKV